MKDENTVPCPFFFKKIIKNSKKLYKAEKMLSVTFEIKILYPDSSFGKFLLFICFYVRIYKIEGYVALVMSPK